jgi:hypothetical protein
MALRSKVARGVWPRRLHSGRSLKSLAWASVLECHLRLSQRACVSPNQISRPHADHESRVLHPSPRLGRCAGITRVTE